ncbi:MAG: Maf family protein [Gammaproteobacteria bacterium]
MPSTRQLVLASSSGSRRKQLSRLGVDFLCIAPDIDETPLAQENAEQLVSRLSLAKARKVAESYADALVIGGDQTAMVDGQFLTKPLTVENAVNQLSYLQGREVCFYSGICVVDSKSSRAELLVSPCTVRFRRLSRSQIEQYVRFDQPLHAAGSFRTESAGIALFEKMRSDDPSSITGMPLVALVTLLKRHDFHLFGD